LVSKLASELPVESGVIVAPVASRVLLEGGPFDGLEVDSDDFADTVTLLGDGGSRHVYRYKGSMEPTSPAHGVPIFEYDGVAQ
jgi:hypothetical protein